MMHTAKPRMVVPYGLKTLLEGVSRAVLKASPSNITEFAAVYFRELIVFREGWRLRFLMSDIIS